MVGRQLWLHSVSGKSLACRLKDVREKLAIMGVSSYSGKIKFGIYG
ncbi:MAG: hypothetical protein HC862_05490 [Scytonema sp. RU_4_4]|nr:hypothetical protein [Scytonema sp. RU_4_4]